MTKINFSKILPFLIIALWVVYLQAQFALFTSFNFDIPDCHGKAGFGCGLSLLFIMALVSILTSIATSVLCKIRRVMYFFVTLVLCVIMLFLLVWSNTFLSETFNMGDLDFTVLLTIAYVSYLLIGREFFVQRFNINNSKLRSSLFWLLVFIIMGVVYQIIMMSPQINRQYISNDIYCRMDSDCKLQIIEKYCDRVHCGGGLQAKNKYNWEQVYCLDEYNDDYCLTRSLNTVPQCWKNMCGTIPDSVENYQKIFLDKNSSLYK